MRNVILLFLLVGCGGSNGDGHPDAGSPADGGSDAAQAMDAAPANDAGVDAGSPGADAGPPAPDAGPQTDAAGAFTLAVTANELYANCMPGIGGPPSGDPGGTITVEVGNASGAPADYRITSVTITLVGATMTSATQTVTVDTTMGTAPAGTTPLTLMKTDGTPMLGGCSYCGAELDIEVTMEIGGATLVATSTDTMFTCAR